MKYAQDLRHIADIFDEQIEITINFDEDCNPEANEQLIQPCYIVSTAYGEVYIPLSNVLDMKKLLYNFFLGEGHSPERWGVLTGVRPIKLAHIAIKEYLAKRRLEELSKSDIDFLKQSLSEKYYVSEDTANMMLEIALVEKKYIEEDSNLAALYISIPFCPTRCLYCSFPAEIHHKKKKLIPTYLELLKKEIGLSLEIAKRKRLAVDCIYIGGGTPSVLNAQELDDLLSYVDRLINKEQIREYTFEAGRVDTIDLEKLQILKKYGVGRISINPQTLTPEAQKSVGRVLSEQELRDCFALVRNVGGMTINSDIIIGLPFETTEGLSKTLSVLCELAPENITIHSLSVKRGSRLNENLVINERMEKQQFSSVTSRDKRGSGYGKSVSDRVLVNQLYEEAMHLLKKNEYLPYYLYRQKHTSGNLHNTGFAKKECESLYNIRIIEESHTIIACGVGAVSKIIFRNENRHERLPNINSLEEYINRFDELMTKKEEKWVNY